MFILAVIQDMELNMTRFCVCWMKNYIFIHFPTCFLYECVWGGYFIAHQYSGCFAISKFLPYISIIHYSSSVSKIKEDIYFGRDQLKFIFRDFHILWTSAVFIISSTSISKQPMVRNKAGNCQILYYKSIYLSVKGKMIFRYTLSWEGNSCLQFLFLFS